MVDMGRLLIAVLSCSDHRVLTTSALELSLTVVYVIN